METVDRFSFPGLEELEFFLAPEAAFCGATKMETAPSSKELIILLDVSGSMSGCRLKAAQSALKSIFDETLEVPGGFARASILPFNHACAKTPTSVSRSNFVKHIDSLWADGGTQFNKVMDVLFQTLSGSSDTHVLFVTDGDDEYFKPRNLVEAAQEKFIQNGTELVCHSIVIGDHELEYENPMKWFTEQGSTPGFLVRITSESKSDEGLKDTLEKLGNFCNSKRITLSNAGDGSREVRLVHFAPGTLCAAVLREKEEQQDQANNHENDSSSSSSAWTLNGEPVNVVDAAAGKFGLEMEFKLLNLALLQLTNDKHRHKLANVYQKYMFPKLTAQVSVEALAKASECVRIVNALQSGSRDDLAMLKNMAVGLVLNQFSKNVVKRDAVNKIHFVDEYDRLKLWLVENRESIALDLKQNRLAHQATCFLSQNNYLDAVLEMDCMTIPLSVECLPASEVSGAQIKIKEVLYGQYVSSKHFCEAFLFKSKTEGAKRVRDHGFVSMLTNSTKMNACLPMYIDSTHWTVAAARMPELLGWIYTNTPFGYMSDYMKTFPFKVLLKIKHDLLEETPLSVVRDTHDQVYQVCREIVNMFPVHYNSTIGDLDEFLDMPRARVPGVVPCLESFLMAVDVSRDTKYLATYARMVVRLDELHFVLFEEQLRRKLVKIFERERASAAQSSKKNKAADDKFRFFDISKEDLLNWQILRASLVYSAAAADDANSATTVGEMPEMKINARVLGEFVELAESLLEKSPLLKVARSLAPSAAAVDSARRFAVSKDSILGVIFNCIQYGLNNQDWSSYMSAQFEERTRSSPLDYLRDVFKQRLEFESKLERGRAEAIARGAVFNSDVGNFLAIRPDFEQFAPRFVGQNFKQYTSALLNAAAQKKKNVGGEGYEEWYKRVCLLVSKKYSDLSKAEKNEAVKMNRSREEQRRLVGDSAHWFMGKRQFRRFYSIVHEFLGKDRGQEFFELVKSIWAKSPEHTRFHETAIPGSSAKKSSQKPQRRSVETVLIKLAKTTENDTAPEMSQLRGLWQEIQKAAQAREIASDDPLLASLNVNTFAVFCQIAGSEIEVASAANIRESAIAGVNMYTLNVATGLYEISFKAILDGWYSVPFLSGYLAFRELPVLQPLFDSLPSKPDVCFFDSYGYFHPRKFGLATHFGVLNDTITVGITREFYFLRHEEEEGENKNKKMRDHFPVTCTSEVLTWLERDLGLEAHGQAVPIVSQVDQTLYGYAWRGGANAKSKKPMYVSRGNKISSATALKLAQHIESKCSFEGKPSSFFGPLAELHRQLVAHKLAKLAQHQKLQMDTNKRPTFADSDDVGDDTSSDSESGSESTDSE